MPTQQMFLGLGAADYEVKDSLRFNNDDSPYLQRVSSTGNTKTWTLSFWMKFCEITGSTNQRLWSCDGNSGTYDMFKIEFYGGSDANRRLAFIDNNHASIGVRFTTNRCFRDPNAWYHIVLAVDTTQATASNRVKIYINGEQETEWLSGSEHNHQPNQDYSTSVNANLKTHTWGRSFSFGSTSADYFDGYLAEIHHIDGSQLTPSSFAETDSKTGQYKPKKYSGSYGTNGYFLNFSTRGETSTTMGKDYSGNGNNFTPNNLEISDFTLDSPTNNFCTLNILQGHYSAIGSTTYSEGNLKVVTPNSGTGNIFSTMSFTSGKWYAEVYVKAYSSLERYIVGVSGGVIDTVSAAQNIGGNSGSIDVGYFGQTGVKNVSGSESSYGDTYTVGDIIGVALDLDNRTVNFYKNNTAQGTISIASTGEWSIGTGDTSGGGGSTMIMNFGQDSSFGGNKTAQSNKDGNGKGDFYYSPPSGFVAMCSANFPDPTIKIPDKHFDILTWTGNSSTSDRSITGLNFQPDFAWTKTRNYAYHHALFDSVRGAAHSLNSDQNYAENHTGGGDLASFDSGGITWDYGSGNEWWNLNYNYISWNWKGGGSAVSNSDGTITSSVSANNTAGFSIVSYTGTGSNATVGHGLGVTPDAIILKARDRADNWWLYHKGLSDPSTKAILLNSLNAEFTPSTSAFNPSAFTSSVFGILTDNASNANTEKYIAYCFKEIEGYSKFGEYRGNSSNNGPFVYLGFRPAWLIVKRRDGSNTNWTILDNKRDPSNLTQTRLFTSSNSADSISSGDVGAVDFVSNGFKVKDSHQDGNSSSGEYIYLAFAESPFKYSRAT